MKTIKPKVIFFDTSDTLYHSPSLEEALKKAPMHFLAEREQVTEKEAKKVIEKAKKELENKGVVATKCEIIRYLGFSNRDLQNYMSLIDTNRYLKKNEEDIVAVEELSKSYCLGIITNINRRLFFKVIASLGMGKSLFKCIVTSDDVVNPKPHIEPFVLASNLIGQPPESCYYVGDNIEKDLVPAHKVGFGTILLSQKRVEKENSFYLRVTNIREINYLFE